MKSMKDLLGEELYVLPKPTADRAFDGLTYEAKRDYLRLDCQLGKVFNLMKDGEWRTLGKIAESADGSEAACSARLRDLRKTRYGGHMIERRHMGRGLFQYRLTVR